MHIEERPSEKRGNARHWSATKQFAMAAIAGSISVGCIVNTALSFSVEKPQSSTEWKSLTLERSGMATLMAVFPSGGLSIWAGFAGYRHRKLAEGHTNGALIGEYSSKEQALENIYAQLDIQHKTRVTRDMLNKADQVPFNALNIS